MTPLMACPPALDYYEGETPGPLTGVPEAERLEAVKYAYELGNDINARTHLGDLPDDQQRPVHAPDLSGERWTTC